MTASKLSFSKYTARGAGVLLGLFFLVFIVYPFIILILNSLGIAPGNHRPDFSYMAEIMTNPETWRALSNTLQAAFGTVVCTTLIAGTLAWIVVRTDFPYKNLVTTLTLLTFMIPSYILGLSWLQLCGRNGYLHRIITAVGGTGDYNFQYYSVGAVIAVMSVHLYPLVFMALRNTLENYDPSLENAAVLSGAGPVRAALTVTIPLILPGICSIGLLVFSRTMANFGIPALLALPVRKEFLTTRIFASLSSLDLNEATTLSLFLVLISALIFASQNLLFRGKKFTTAHTGKSMLPKFSLGKGKWPVTAAILLFQGITTILPLAAILLSSFLKRWGLPLKWEYLTINNYVQLLFRNSQTMGAFRNSIVYGITGAMAAGIVGSTTAFIVHSSKLRTGKLLEFTATWPMAFPNIVLAVAAILAWSSPPLTLYGTPWAIILTYTVLFIPIVMKNVTGLIANHDGTLLSAARVSGASPFRSFMDVTLPAVAPGIKSGCLLCFLIALREIPISLMLYSSGQETLGVLLFGMQSQSYGLEMTSALAVVIIFLTFIGNRIIQSGKKGIRK